MLLLVMDKRVMTERAKEVTILNFQEILRSLAEVLNRSGVFRTSWNRSSCPEVFCKKGVLINFPKLHTHSWNFIKKRLRHRCFPVIFKQFFSAYFGEHLRQLLFLTHLRCSFFSKMFNDWKLHFRWLKDLRITLWIASEIFQTLKF